MLYCHESECGGLEKWGTLTAPHRKGDDILCELVGDGEKIEEDWRTHSRRWGDDQV